MENSQSKAWFHDTQNLSVEVAQNILYVNENIETFLERDNKHFIVAGSGMGKSLLLKVKRFLLEKYYKYNVDEDNGVIFIPEKEPFVNFIPEFDVTSDFESILEDWINCKKIWLLAIELSAISYYRYRCEEHLQIYDKLDEIVSSFLPDCKYEQQPLLPVKILLTILSKDLHEIYKFFQRHYSIIEHCFNTIHSSMVFFIDNADQAFIHYSRDVWAAFQIGLLEASWDLMRINPHVKINISLRQEAYAWYESPNKQSISGMVSIIKYSYKDLIEIIDKLSMVYEGKPFYNFIGFSHIQSIVGYEEVFSYIYRHTLGRPRGLVYICNELSGVKPISVDNLRDIVHWAAQERIIKSFLNEINMLLCDLKEDFKRQKLFELIPANILTIDDLANICKFFNGSSCTLNCDECKTLHSFLLHPFCEMYRIGLLGVISENDNGDFIQKFIEPYEAAQSYHLRLPLNTPYYLLHPSLEYTIRQIRQNTNQKYIPFKRIIIGSNQPWYNNYSLLVAITKNLENINSQKQRAEIVDMLDTYLNNPDTQKVERDLSDVLNLCIDIVNNQRN